MTAQDSEIEAGVSVLLLKDAGDGRHKIQAVMEENYTLRKDTTTTPRYTYYGEAQPGTTNTAAAWRIFRSGPDGISWLNGSDLFVNTWDPAVYAGSAVYP